jgi:hypothetical protein
MTTIQLNLLSTYLAIKNVADRHQHLIQSLPALATAYAEFLARLNTISHLGQIQSEITVGVTLDKQQLRVAMCDTGLEVAGALRAWAKTQKNDRVGCRGLRLGTLPHHRTCGFPHPAVERSGWFTHGPRGLMA